MPRTLAAPEVVKEAQEGEGPRDPSHSPIWAPFVTDPGEDRAQTASGGSV
jgi:hypothetical protein